MALYAMARCSAVCPSVCLSVCLSVDDTYIIVPTCNIQSREAELDNVMMSPSGQKGKGKGFPYSTPSVGPGADPGVQAVSLQVTVSHTPRGRLPLLFARPAVTSPAAKHHRPLVGTN